MKSFHRWNSLLLSLDKGIPPFSKMLIFEMKYIDQIGC